MAYEYANGVLGLRRAQNFHPLTEVLVQREQPVYVYDSEDILTRVGWFRSSFSRSVRVHFALKANPHPPLLKLLVAEKIGADVVSGGELQRALDVGIPAANIVFSGVAKSRGELELALKSGVGQINVESLPELQRLAELSRGRAAPTRIALRLNPDVKPDTHHHITTGHRDNKFGLDMESLPDALDFLRKQPQLKLFGLAMHVGSQIMEVSSILEAVTRLKVVFQDLRQSGWSLQTLDLGGGLGIDYGKTDQEGDHARLKNFAREVDALLKDVDAEILLEPGRFLVARAGVLLTKIEYVKETPHRCFVIVNTGMNHLMRPALYQAEHRIVPVQQRQTSREVRCDIVGPICESTDILGRDRLLHDPKSGDWLAVLDTGAYGFSMANQYNLRPLPDQILL